VQELLDMLTYRRPHGSRAETKFIRRFLRPLPGARQDAYGNVIVRVGKSQVLWSSHTDTVHREGGRQLVSVSTTGIATAPHSNCLGADCTTGVWIMMEMIRAKVPGLYIFHRAEEVGGIGSDYIATKTPELLKGIEYAIAFDRYGKTSIITHQLASRCASDAFAYSFAHAASLPLFPDPGGTFTDTANYTRLVNECTNISVGYTKQHTEHETQDLAFARELRDAMVLFDESRLVSQRDAAAVDDRWVDIGDNFYGAPFGSNRMPYQHDDEYLTKPQSGRQALLQCLRDYPEAVVDLLEDYGLGVHDIFQHSHEFTGRHVS
jgi:hypothetical protein